MLKEIEGIDLKNSEIEDEGACPVGED